MLAEKGRARTAPNTRAKTDNVFTVSSSSGSISGFILGCFPHQTRVRSLPRSHGGPAIAGAIARNPLSHTPRLAVLNAMPGARASAVMFCGAARVRTILQYTVHGAFIPARCGLAKAARCRGSVNYLRAWVRAAFCSCAASMVMVLSSSFLRGKDIIRSNSTPGDAAARESRQCYRASSDFFCGKPPHGSLHVGLATLFSANMKRLPLCTSSVV